MAALTVVGGVLRAWSAGRLGLVHFDEGIYAMAGCWVLSPRGLGGLDPTLISYAPPGFPFLVGLAYGLLGVSDLPAILVSIAAGTLTIPVVGWLAYRSFGQGAGAAAAAFAALSGPHIAFSRMALTDASFLLFWLLAIGQGQRFLERPGPGRAAAMGLSVGVAQLFKYNGWIAGLVFVTSAAAWTILRPGERTAHKQLALWGWGVLGALAAAIVYWPWYRFVEAHGGYGALLAHQRGYLGGLASWPGHALVQLAQDRALSGGIGWLVVVGFAGAIAMLGATGAPSMDRRSRPRDLLVALSLTSLCAFFHGALFGAILWVIVLAATGAGPPSKAGCVLAVGWGVLAMMTPFYHPYARLMLPLQSLAWILLGGAFTTLRQVAQGLSELEQRRVWGLPESLIRFAAACWLVPLLLAVFPSRGAVVATIRDLLGPSDSLRRACRSILRDLPGDLGLLRLYARPPVTFYLSGAVPVAPQATAHALFAAYDARSWALLDAAMIRQGGGPRGRLPASAERWDLAGEFPTTLNWPTLLDVDPLGATRRAPERSAPLLLFRPKRPGADR